MTTTISSRAKRTTGIVLLSLVIFIALFFLLQISGFFFLSLSDYSAQADRATWHHLYTKTTFRNIEVPTSEEGTITHNNAPSSGRISVSRPCTASVRGGYLAPPFPFFKFETGGCEDVIDYYISYEFAAKSLVLYLIFLMIAIGVSYKTLRPRPSTDTPRQHTPFF